MNIVKDTTANKGNRKGHKPDMIVCHITEGSFSGTIAWLKNPSSFVSSHFVVAKDGRVTQLVDIEDAAWAQGLSITSIPKARLRTVRSRGVNPNLYCISIEFEGIYDEKKGALTKAQKSSAVDLIKHIRAEVKRIYDLDIPADREHIVGHSDINPVGKPNCPGEMFPFDAIIAAVKGYIEPKPLPIRIELSAGDRVKIKPSALVYFTGERIPDWVKRRIYTVMRINTLESRALLKEIYSWVYLSDIEPVADDSETNENSIQDIEPKPEPKPLPQPPKDDISRKRFRVGERVHVKTDALRFYTGEKIPYWVKDKVHTIMQINSSEGKVLLKEIYSWVKISDIEKI